MGNNLSKIYKDYATLYKELLTEYPLLNSGFNKYSLSTNSSTYNKLCSWMPAYKPRVIPTTSCTSILKNIFDIPLLNFDLGNVNMSSSAIVNVLSNINKPFEYKGIKVNVIYREDGKSLTRARDVCDILGLNKKDSMKALDRHVPRRHKIPFRELKTLEINMKKFHPDNIFLTST